MSEYKAKDYKSNTKPSWCPGCGDFAVLAALTSVMAELQLVPDETAVVSGIGCSSRFPFFTSTYGFHSIHGRALPIATGLKSASPKTNVITVGGDGDGFSIGGNHFIHASRKNPNITYIVMDNEIYALTKGQHSPTSHSELTTKVSPYMSMEERVNPLLMALSFNASFVARSFSGDMPQLKEMIKKGIEHKGFSFIHVLSPCIQYNDHITFDSVQERIRTLPDNHDTKDRIKSMELAFSPGLLYTGLFYQEERETYEEKLEAVEKMSQEKIDKSNVLKEIIQQFA